MHANQESVFFARIAVVGAGLSGTRLPRWHTGQSRGCGMGRTGRAAPSLLLRGLGRSWGQQRGACNVNY